MQGVGLDRIDLPRRAPPRQQQEGHAQHQPAEARNQQRAQRLDAELAGKALPHFKVEKQDVEALDRRTHGNDHQAADGSDQGREDHQTRFVRTDECAQPSRRLKIRCRRGHFRVRQRPEGRAARPV